MTEWLVAIFSYSTVLENAKFIEMGLDQKFRYNEKCNHFNDFDIFMIKLRIYIQVN